MPASSADSLSSVTRELGSLIDARWTGQRTDALKLLRETPEIEAFAGKSEIHQRCFVREQFLLLAILHHPSQYVIGKWPYTSLFMGEPKLARLRDDDPLVHITDREAHLHYLLRAKQCRDAVLCARYWDFAALTCYGRTTIDVTKKAIASLLSAAKRLSVQEQHDDGFLMTCRAFALALGKGLSTELARIKRRVVAELNALLPNRYFVAASLVYGVARLDKKRQHFDYSAIADRFEAVALELSALPKKRRRKKVGFGSVFAVAFGIAGVTQEPDRIQRVGRLHAEALLDFADERQREGDTGLNVRHWLNEAKEVLGQLSDCDDLRTRLKRRLRAVRGQMIGDMQTHSLPATQLDEATIQGLRQLSDSIVEAGEDWPRRAFQAYIAELPTKRQAEESGRSVFDGLVANVRVSDDETIQTDGSDWRHSYSMQVSFHWQLLWPLVFRQALIELEVRDELNIESMLRPFAAHGLPDEDLHFAVPAASAFLTGDFVGATQQWVLMVERALRFVVRVCGGSTTAIRGGSPNDGEAVFDSAVREFERLIAAHDNEIAEQVSHLLMCVFSWRGYGWNLRNEVAHGTAKVRSCGMDKAFLAYLLNVLVMTFVVPVEPSGGSKKRRTSSRATASKAGNGKPQSRGRGTTKRTGAKRTSGKREPVAKPRHGKQRGQQ